MVVGLGNVEGEVKEDQEKGKQGTGEKEEGAKSKVQASCINHELKRNSNGLLEGSNMYMKK